MRKQQIRPINDASKSPAVWLLAAALCLCPAAAQALDPTSTATGTGALVNETTGSYNTADGYEALNQNTTGSYNTASGGSALRSNVGGDSNTAGGFRALYSNNAGNYNTASGDSALFSNTTGSYNTASGILALFDNTTGSYNTASGYNALYNNTTGQNNVAVGASALYNLNGSNNIALGGKAGRLTKLGNANIYIGHAGINGNESRVMRIGDAQTRTFIAGIAGTALSGASVVVRSTGQLGVVASSARYKQDIKPLGGASSAAEQLQKLRPVSYRYKTEPEVMHYGLIAEEVDKAMPELVVRDEQNRPESVQYIEIVPLLLQQWKAQRELNARQDAVIDAQAGKIATLERRLAALEAALTRSPRREASAQRADGVRMD